LVLHQWIIQDYRYAGRRAPPSRRIKFETLGGGIDRARADVNDTIGVLRRRLEKPETKELPSLPPAKSLNNSMVEALRFAMIASAFRRRSGKLLTKRDMDLGLGRHELGQGALGACGGRFQSGDAVDQRGARLGLGQL
jgi:hypothetical protein